MADDLPEVPRLISLEGRAELIADQVNRIEHCGDPARRREAVRREALAHLQVVAARAAAEA